MDMDTTQWIETLHDGSRVLVRAIRPGDKARDAAFIAGLSERSRRMRFLGQVRGLSDAELRRLTEIDQVHDVAFVAISEVDDHIVGISRYSRMADGEGCECAVAVADEWQGVGLGARLMHYLIEDARARGLRRMVSFDLAENAEMRELAHFLGFSTRPDKDDARMVVHELALA